MHDRWQCIEVHVVQSDTDGSVEVFVDGTSVLLQTGFGTRPAGGYGMIGAGITYSSPAQVPLELYLDELAIGTTRLPCD